MFSNEILLRHFHISYFFSFWFYYTAAKYSMFVFFFFSTGLSIFQQLFIKYFKDFDLDYTLRRLQKRQWKKNLLHQLCLWVINAISCFSFLVFLNMDLITQFTSKKTKKKNPHFHIKDYITLYLLYLLSFSLVLHPYPYPYQHQMKISAFEHYLPFSFAH